MEDKEKIIKLIENAKAKTNNNDVFIALYNLLKEINDMDKPFVAGVILSKHINRHTPLKE